jgi:hypothetical protein
MRLTDLADTETMVSPVLVEGKVVITYNDCYDMSNTIALAEFKAHQFLMNT